MRISLFAVLCAILCHSLLSVIVVHGGEVNVVVVDDEREMVTSFTFDASVLWYNDNALSTDCTDAEQMFVMNRMVPNLNLILNKNGYSPVPWSKSRTKLVRERFLRGAFLDADRRDLQSSRCQTCVRHNSKTYCNALYNCGFRRTLTVEQHEQQQQQQHHREDQALLTATTTTTTSTTTATATSMTSMIQTQFTSVCMAQLAELSANVMLQDSCRNAVGGSVCQVTIA